MKKTLLPIFKNSLLILLAAILCQNVNAQAPAGASQNAVESAAKGNSKISGIVLDSAAAKGVEFASIALFSATENKAIDGTTADENGSFTISKVAPGTY